MNIRVLEDTNDSLKDYSDILMASERLSLDILNLIKSIEKYENTRCKTIESRSIGLNRILQITEAKQNLSGAYKALKDTGRKISRVRVASDVILESIENEAPNGKR
jgi:hypothetical protein